VVEMNAVVGNGKREALAEVIHRHYKKDAVKELVLKLREERQDQEIKEMFARLR
jgi:hypothetical protein